MATLTSTETRPSRYLRMSLTWPVLLITVGLLFLFDQFVPRWDFERTWPILLIVIGVMKLIESGRPPRPPEGPRL
jgi:phage shock protein C